MLLEQRCRVMRDSQEDALLGHPLSLVRRQPCPELVEERVDERLTTPSGFLHVSQLAIVDVHDPEQP